MIVCGQEIRRVGWTRQSFVASLTVQLSVDIEKNWFFSVDQRRWFFCGFPLVHGVLNCSAVLTCLFALGDWQRLAYSRPILLQIFVLLYADLLLPNLSVFHRRFQNDILDTLVSLLTHCWLTNSSLAPKFLDISSRLSCSTSNLSSWKMFRIHIHNIN